MDEKNSSVIWHKWKETANDADDHDDDNDDDYDDRERGKRFTVGRNRKNSSIRNHKPNVRSAKFSGNKWKSKGERRDNYRRKKSNCWSNNVDDNR